MLTNTEYRSPEDVGLQLDITNHMWDKSPYIAYLGTQSASYREDSVNLLDIRVGARHEERIDVYLAANPGSPIIVFIHGGWWRGGTRKEYGVCAHGLVSRGYTVVISDYTLCPSGTIPDISQASRAAVIWAYEHASQINGDAERIFVVGHSAGGQQAAMMGVTDWTQYSVPRDIVKGVVPMSGVFDLYPFKYCWLQSWLQLTGDTVRSESPIFHIRADMPPTFIMLGEQESEEFHRQSMNYAQALSAAGQAFKYLALEDEDHSSCLFMLTDPSSSLCTAIDSFIQSID